MIDDGARYQRCQAVVALWNVPNGLGPNYSHYITFGKLVKPGKPVPANAVPTGRIWNHTGEAAYAVPIKAEGYSRTNLMYGADGRMYLCKNGSCYSRPGKKKTST